MANAQPILGQVEEHGTHAADALLEAGWLLVAILTPLGVNLWARQPFEPPKAALLRSLVWLMAGVWLASCLLAHRSPWRDLGGNPLRWPALAAAAVLALATVFAVDRRLSLWGSYERAQGALTLLSYPLLFLMVAARLRTLDGARRLVGVMLVTGAPLVGIGLAQALGWEPIGLISDARSPVYATLGRPNFLGAYLAILLPLTLALVLVARPRWLRIAGAALALLEAIVVGLTLARGAWLAAGVAVGTFGLLWYWPRLTRPWRTAATVGGLVGLGGGLVGALWLGQAQAGSTAARLTIWRATLDLIARRPLLGYGPDALGLVFPRVYPPQLVYYQGRSVLVDRAHNLLLDWTVTTGVLGLLAGLALLVAFFFVGWRAARRAADTERRVLLTACLAAVAGATVGNLVSFNVTATATATWLLMALTVSLAAPGRPSKSAECPDRQPWRWAMAGLMLAGVGVAVVQINGRPLVADVAAQVTDDRAAAGDWSGAIATGERAVALWPIEPAHHLTLSWAYLQLAQAGGDEFGLGRAEAELLVARDLRPDDFRIWAALGELYGVWGNRWEASKLPLAHDAYRKATELAPHHAMLYTAWGMVDLKGGRFVEAADRFRQAVDLDATDGYAFSYLGDAELALGRVDEALAAYRQAVHWEPGLSHAHLGLARCYWRLGQPEAAGLVLERALQLDPDNAAARSLQQQMGLGP